MLGGGRKFRSWGGREAESFYRVGAGARVTQRSPGSQGWGWVASFGFLESGGGRRLAALRWLLVELEEWPSLNGKEQKFPGLSHLILTTLWGINAKDDYPYFIDEKTEVQREGRLYLRPPRE